MKRETRKVCLTSLGCPKNLVDSEVMLGFLAKEGYEITTEEAEADILVVNTCGFVADAKKESVEAILRLAEFKKTGRCGSLVVAGCLTQRYKDEISGILPEVDLFVGTGEYHKIAGLLANPGHGQVFAGKPVYIHDYDTPRILATPRHYAYLKISEGCSNHCAYCTIPEIRGELRSRTSDSIVKEAEFLASSGVKEINIVSNDSTSYGRDLKYRDGLTQLLKRLTRIEGIVWIRLLYLYPDRITDGLIELIKEEEKICKYIEMPIQHINDRVLKAMRRTYDRRLVESLLEKLRKEIAGVVLRTTLITGFPSETEEEFGELLEFVRAAKFERLGAFAYSKEKDTPA
ncbi:MAG: 30S ribosomal protein S12 methylthiotransferase RimO, partial [Deltaproteobacteria bacterium]|nr:30S ribosomal protein S12 methylthiotransferase RimO [Deltaproteobacteria bacterium]